jgi:hypothetical protein
MFFGKTEGANNMRGRTFGVIVIGKAGKNRWDDDDDNNYDDGYRGRDRDDDDNDY